MTEVIIMIVHEIIGIIILFMLQLAHVSHSVVIIIMVYELFLLCI